jgi:predicted Zn-dependent protease
MGKASALDDYLETHPLTPAEIKLRRAAEQISDPDIEVTLDGGLIKRTTPAAAPTVVQQAPDRTWD